MQSNRNTIRYSTGICDVCNAATSFEEGTTYTAKEFRKIVSRGFRPDETDINAMATMLGIIGMTREQTIVHWSSNIVMRSTTAWLLCPSCASRAAQYISKRTKNKSAQKSAPKFCTECGFKLVDPNKFCTNCGNKL